LAFVWIVSEDDAAARAAEIPLRRLGDTASGPPERSEWKEVREPDLVVLVGAGGPVERLETAERLLGFLAGVERFRRPPVPALYIEPPGGHPPAALFDRLLDDRPSGSIRWSRLPQEILQVATELLHQPLHPPTLRERARTGWIRRRVELLYAALDLPELRRAIDPRNADRPVLLVGEAGTERGLVARYVHQLAEPLRHRFVRITLEAIAPGELETRILEQTADAHATLYLHGVERAPRAVQEELVELLTEAGALALESVRWIVSSDPSTGGPWEMRLAPWIRVELPPLREREDLDELVGSLARDFARRSGREIAVPPETLGELRRYAWPGNLAELVAVVEASLEGAGAEVLRAEDLRFDPTSAQGETRAAVEAHAEAAPVERPVEAAPEQRRAEPVRAEEPHVEPPAPEETVPEPTSDEPAMGALLGPLVEEIRPTLLALRTYAGLSAQQPEDESVRRRLRSILEGDVRRVEVALDRLDRFAAFGPPRIASVDLATLLSSLLLEELDAEAPRAQADEAQLRFALDAVLDRVLRMVPHAGDLYVGHRSLPATADHPARHRLLIRFHSPEEVLAPPDEAGAGGVPLEVVLARALLERMGGRLSVDVSGPHDNLVLIELPS
jgi:hypothetical protein